MLTYALKLGFFAQKWEYGTIGPAAGPASKESSNSLLIRRL
jgi:hypothetical protein